MIGKAKWFQRRKYGGWGIFPKTWQGWAYLGVLIALFALIQFLPMGNETIRYIVMMVFVLIAILDIIDIMLHIPMDERERLHEATAERNALWVMVAALGGGVIWQAGDGIISQNPQIDPFIIIALILGLLAKAITNIYLDRKN